MHRAILWVLVAALAGFASAARAVADEPVDPLQAALNELATVKTENVELKLELREKIVVSKVNSESVERLKKEVETLREVIRKAQLERDEKNGLNSQEIDELSQLRERNIELTKQLVAFRIALGRMPAADILSAPPKIDGVVLAVSPQGLVEVSVGSDDGLKEGQELEVYRSADGKATYLGTIVIRKTRPERAVGETLKRFMGPVQVNDRVISKPAK